MPSGKKVTEKKAASTAGKLLQKNSQAKSVKRVAASDLSQREKKGK